MWHQQHVIFPSLPVVAPVCRKITDDQAKALAKALRARGFDAEVYVAMRYWHPYTEEALQHVVRDGISNLVILPLYPQVCVCMCACAHACRRAQGLWQG